MRDCDLGSWSLRFALFVVLFAPGVTACQRERQLPEKGAAGSKPVVTGTGGAPASGPGGAAAPTDVTTSEAAGGRAGTAPLWASWPVPNPRSTGLPNPTSYEVNPKGTVLDKVTGLEWQQKVDGKGQFWNEAQDICQRLELAGHTDWRLPSRIELSSIVDVTRSNPSIDQRAFPRTPKEPFWTSSVLAANPSGAAWCVRFDLGDPKADPTNSVFRVRCVRAPESTELTKRANPKQSLSTPSYDVQKETVRDRGTGLLWQRVVPAQGFNFEEARQHCVALRLGGQDGWRVPSMGELMTLVDERRWNPTIDLKAFPKASTDASWTSSLFAGKPAMAWQVTFEHGNASHGPLKEPHPVRCVR